LKSDLEASQKATKPLESDMIKLQAQLDGIKGRLTTIENDIVKKEAAVKKGEQALVAQKKILDKRVNLYYRNVKKAEVSLITLLVSDNLSVSLKNFFYQKSVADQDKQAIINLIVYITGLEESKKTLESERSRLAVAKKTVDTQSTFLSGEVSKAKKFQSELSGKIASLSARQQSLVASKLAGLNIPRSAGTSAGGCSDDRDKDPGFSNAFAFFTYGVPNRTGLNQYGARGRAESGQSSDTILRAYYNFDSYQNMDATIKVNDSNGINSGNIIWSGSLDDYVKRIYEVPESWPIESLKAQAVAARSYVLAQTDNGNKSICATTYCQVFKTDKTDPKGGNWDAAVSQTANQVMVQGGKPITAYFSSTHGGYILSTSEIGWSGTSWTKHGTDTTSGNAANFGDLQNNAYDKSSPWFYCDWGYRSSYNNTAWLKSEEVADIANSLALAKADSSTQTHLSQPDKSNPDGVDTWDAGKVKSELSSRGISAFSSVSSVSISADFSAGRATSVSISGDAGIKSFDGGEFKSFFNLRAPANIQIVGPLYNVEKK
ncbi:MAG: SpoIID/LytB domain-containing protein, partial [Microgenomates group bacterium]